jgi:hypothetical protein
MLKVSYNKIAKDATNHAVFVRRKEDNQSVSNGDECTNHSKIIMLSKAPSKGSIKKLKKRFWVLGKLQHMSRNRVIPHHLSDNAVPLTQRMYKTTLIGTKLPE